VKAAAVVQRKIAAGQPFVGTIMPLRRSTVGSAVAGRIVSFKHNEGDYVEEGEVLAQVLTGTIEIELAQARAELKVREAELEESERSFPAEKQQADARLAAARARRDHAQAKFKRMQALRERNSASEEAFDEAKATGACADY
jgi:multidrug resistance efflux pump